MCAEVIPVEESIPHLFCKTATFSNTVFENYCTCNSITTFEKLPKFLSKLVFEDALESPVSVVSIDKCI